MKKLVKTENQKNKKVFAEIGKDKTLKDLYTIEDLSKPEIEETHHFRLDKDGTNYDILVFEIKGMFGNNNIGYLKNGILVIAGNKGAYMFRKGEYLSADYILEKICRGWSITDANNIKIGLEKRGLANTRCTGSTMIEET